jgi:hypothetical protein
MTDKPWPQRRGSFTGMRSKTMTISKFFSLTAAATMVVTSLGVAAPASARDHGYDRYGNGRYERDYRGYQRDDYRDYRRNDYRDARYQNNYRGNYRCNNDGTTGTIIGAIAGGLIGHEAVGRRGDRTTGTIVGGAVGAIAGRAIDKGGNNYCR